MSSHPEPGSEFIGSAEICRQHNVNPSSVSRWAASGELAAAHKLPGRNGALFFRRVDVEKFFADRAEAEARRIASAEAAS